MSNLERFDAEIESQIIKNGTWLKGYRERNPIED